MELTLVERDIDEIDLLAIVKDPLIGNIKNFLIEFTSSGTGANQLLRISEIQPLKNSEVIGAVEDTRNYRSNAPFPHQTFTYRPNICRGSRGILDQILEAIGKKALPSEEGSFTKVLSLMVLSAIPFLENVASEINQFLNYLYFLTAPRLFSSVLKIPDNELEGKLALNDCALGDYSNRNKLCLNIYIPDVVLEDKNAEELVNIATRIIRLKYKLAGSSLGRSQEYANTEEFVKIVSEIVYLLQNNLSGCFATIRTICEETEASFCDLERISKVLYYSIAKPLEPECNYLLSLEHLNSFNRVTIFVPTVRKQADAIGEALALIFRNTLIAHPSVSLEIRCSYTRMSESDAKKVCRNIHELINKSGDPSLTHGRVRVILDPSSDMYLIPPPSEPEATVNKLISFIEEGSLLLLIPEIPKAIILELSKRVTDNEDISSKILLLVPKKKVCLPKDEGVIGFFKVNESYTVDDVVHRYSNECLAESDKGLFWASRRSEYCITAPFNIAKNIEVKNND